jgi:hypothetical protein
MTGKEAVHPLALGTVKRSTSQARMLGRRLLQTRQVDNLEEHEIEEVLRALTSELFYHGHPINRMEAHRELGLRFVKEAPEDVADLMWRIYESYVEDMRMYEPFILISELSAKTGLPNVPPLGQPPAVKRAILDPVQTVFVESVRRTDVFEMMLEAVVQRHPSGQLESGANLLRVGWRELLPQPGPPLASVEVDPPEEPLMPFPMGGPHGPAMIMAPGAVATEMVPEPAGGTGEVPGVSSVAGEAPDAAPSEDGRSGDRA